MKIFLNEDERNGTPSLRVKGRLMPYEEFRARLKNFCASLGFKEVNIRHVASFGDLGPSADILPDNADDAVVVLSCRVAYNPRWGGYSGLPQLLAREKGDDGGQCPASFIAPFLQQYRYACEHIYLTRTEEGRHLITVPEGLLGINEAHGGLAIALDRIAAPDHNGAIVPIMTNGSMITYTLSDAFRHTLDDSKFDWKTGRSTPIGHHLGSELFIFTGIEQTVDPGNPFCPTLLPDLRRIVTHRTPNLFAAELHLRHEFARAIATFIADHGPGLGNLLCLAGLDIDMTAFEGREEHYFVPWQAYLERTGGGEAEDERALDQDDLFVRLMQQDKRCLA